MVRSCPIVELRQYRLWPGRRDVLIDLFDREFVESQEADGMQVLPRAAGEDRRARPCVDPADLREPFAGGAAPSIVRHRP